MNAGYLKQVVQNWLVSLVSSASASAYSQFKLLVRIIPVEGCRCQDGEKKLEHVSGTRALSESKTFIFCAKANLEIQTNHLDVREKGREDSHVG